jgi:hypothetical protein
MTNAYRLEKLAEATTEAAKARARWETMTGKANRDAAEDLEFWTNKKAFLSAPCN